MVNPFKYQRNDNCFKVDIEKIQAGGEKARQEFTELRPYQFMKLMEQADEEDRIRKGELKTLKPCKAEGLIVHLN